MRILNSSPMPSYLCTKQSDYQPMTITMLLMNTLEAAEKALKA
jgi:hypothetical protein